MIAATAVHAIRPDTLLDTVRTQSTIDALAAPRAAGAVFAVCGLHDGSAGSTVTDLLARLFGRLHPGRVVVLDADLDGGALADRTPSNARIELDDLEVFLRTPSSTAPPWSAAAPVITDAGSHPASHVAELLRWSRSRLDTVLVDVPSRWRRAVLESLLPGLDGLVITAQAEHAIDEELGVARHWLEGRHRSDLAARLLVVETDLRRGVQRPARQHRGGHWYHLGAGDPARGWSGLGRRDREELLRLGAALRR